MNQTAPDGYLHDVFQSRLGFSKPASATQKSKPLLSSTELAEAILAGRKTVTRRLIKIQPEWDESGGGWYPPQRLWAGQSQTPDNARHYANAAHVAKGFALDFCPYQVGDHLYVKEACWMWGRWIKDGTTKTGRQKYRFQAVGQQVRFDKLAATVKRDGATGWVYRHARFVPRWASRIGLEVVSVRDERLQAITEEDARREGMAIQEGMTRLGLGNAPVLRDSYRSQFILLWDELNGHRAPWDSNPYVWRVEFKVVTK